MKNVNTANTNIIEPNIFVITDYSQASNLAQNLIKGFKNEKFIELQKTNSAFFIYVSNCKLLLKKLNPASYAKLISLRFRCYRKGLYLISSFGYNHNLAGKDSIQRLGEFIAYTESLFPRISKTIKWRIIKKDFFLNCKKIKRINSIMELEREEWLINKLENSPPNHNLFIPSMNYIALKEKNLELVKLMRITKLYNAFVIDNWCKFNFASLKRILD